MKTFLTTTAALLVIGTAALAENDADKGAKDFNKCKACHSIISPDGEKIVKGGVVGPNLWGVVGRVAGTEPNYGKYDETMIKLGEEGLIWTPENLAAYIPNAKDFLSEKSGEKAKTQMTPQKLKDVTDVIAFLSQYGAQPAADAGTDAAGDTDMDGDTAATEDAGSSN